MTTSRTNNLIKAVFFDLGNVLVKVNLESAIPQIAELFRIPEKAVMQAPILALEKKFERGQLTIAEYLVEVKNIYHTDHSISVDDLERIWQIPFELNTDVWQIALRLRRQVPLFLLSNTNTLHIRAIRRKFNILENMDGLILSFEVGATKPESAIYQYALRKADVTAEQALFIDDLKENVAGAERLGLKAHQFISASDLENILSQYSFQ